MSWGYRRVHCADVIYDADKQTPVSENPGIRESLEWVDKSGIKEFTHIGKTENAAQVHPKYLTSYLLDLAQAGGVNLVFGSAKSINYFSPDIDIVGSVNYTQNGIAKRISATDVIIAAGPWSSQLFPRIPVYGVRSNSIIRKPSRSLSPYVLFPIFDPPISKESPQYEEKDAKEWNGREAIIDCIEIYPRPSFQHKPEEVYICGPDDYPPLPETTDQIQVDANMISGIRNAVSVLSPAVKDGEFILGQACFRPQLRKHAEGEAVGPIVGVIPGVRGLWVATGHDEWGVQNSQGTGKILAGMVMKDEVEGVDVTALDPSNFLTR